MTASQDTIRAPAIPALRDWRDVFDVTFPSFGEETDAAKPQTVKRSQQFRQHVRVSTDCIYTTAEYEVIREEEKARSLP